MYNIKIMKNESTPSDEEIRSYMNFESLLEKRTIAVRRNLLHSFLKWSVPTVVIIGLVTWFLITTRTNTSTITKGIPQLIGEPLIQEVLPIIPSDSFPTALETKQSRSEKPPASDQLVVPKNADQKKNTKIPTPADLYLQAEPVEGYTKLYDYFNSNLSYPAEAVPDSIQGVQTVSFVVNINGKPENIAITQSLGSLFELEARRLIENMPTWKPATLNGRPVPSKVAVPLTFQIKKVRK